MASVLTLKPRLAILDEPTTGIDMLSLGLILAVIRSLQEAGGSVLLITHQEDIALAADRASQLCGGRIVFAGVPADVVRHFQRRVCTRCDGVECGYEQA